jgi:cell division protein ZapA
MSAHPTLDITLLGREYRVACPPEERESLLAAVALVDAKMTEIATQTKSTGERLATMTALNLAHELLAAKAAPEAVAEAAVDSTFDAFDRQEFTRRIGAIEARLDAAMAEQEKLF